MPAGVVVGLAVVVSVDPYPWMFRGRFRGQPMGISVGVSVGVSVNVAVGSSVEIAVQISVEIKMASAMGLRIVPLFAAAIRGSPWNVRGNPWKVHGSPWSVGGCPWNSVDMAVECRGGQWRLPRCSACCRPNSDPGSLRMLFCPLPTSLQDLFFIARVLPSSTRVDQRQIVDRGYPHSKSLSARGASREQKIDACPRFKDAHLKAITRCKGDIFS